jgi:hypothetical protein
MIYEEDGRIFEGDWCMLLDKQLSSYVRFGGSLCADHVGFGFGHHRWGVLLFHSISHAFFCSWIMFLFLGATVVGTGAVGRLLAMAICARENANLINAMVAVSVNGTTAASRWHVW